MTRGNFVIIENGKVYMSLQFNGDMYPSGNGKYVYDMLKNIDSKGALKKAIKRFDEAVFNYGECGCNVAALEVESDLDFSKDYFVRFHSDYLYIKNVDNEPFTIINREGETKTIQPDEIQIWYFGRYEEADEGELEMTQEDKDFLYGRTDAPAADGSETFYPEGSGISEMVKTIMSRLDSELHTALWNKYHRDIDTPFSNTGTKYENDTFSVSAYDWKQEDSDEEASPNFVYKDIRVFWYKHSMRGLYVKSARDITLDDLTSMNAECVQAIKNDKNLEIRGL